MGLKYTEYWYSYAGDTGTVGQIFSDWMTQTYNRLCDGVSASNFLEVGGPFNGCNIEVWHSNRAETTDDGFDWNIEHYAGLTNLSGIKINHQYGNKGCLAHEFGHYYGFKVGYDPDNYASLPGVARGLIDEYNKLRGNEFTNRTNKYERYAEDFKFFFGADGVSGIRNPDDDANHPNLAGKNVRWADEVNGLREFIQYSWPVFNWLKDKSFSNFSYNHDGKYFIWYRSTWWFGGQWECFIAGKFQFWNGSSWVAM